MSPDPVAGCDGRILGRAARDMHVTVNSPVIPATLSSRAHLSSSPRSSSSPRPSSSLLVILSAAKDLCRERTIAAVNGYPTVW
jgi:hypothetical protein